MPLQAEPENFYLWSCHLYMSMYVLGDSVSIKVIGVGNGITNPS